MSNYLLFLILWFISGFCVGYSLEHPQPSVEEKMGPELSIPYVEACSLSCTSSEGMVGPVSEIVFEVMSYPDEEIAGVIANEIIYQMNKYEITQDSLPFILALFYTESHFNPNAANYTSSARGIGQIMMSLHSDKFKNYEDWKNPACNIAVAFQLINGGYGNYKSIEDLSEKWYLIFKRYCGRSSYARAAMDNVEMFQKEINSYYLLKFTEYQYKK